MGDSHPRENKKIIWRENKVRCEGRKPNWIIQQYWLQTESKIKVSIKTEFLLSCFFKWKTKQSISCGDRFVHWSIMDLGYSNINELLRINNTIIQLELHSSNNFKAFRNDGNTIYKVCPKSNWTGCTVWALGERGITRLCYHQTWYPGSIKLILAFYNLCIFSWHVFVYTSSFSGHSSMSTEKQIIGWLSFMVYQPS